MWHREMIEWLGEARMVGSGERMVSLNARIVRVDLFLQAR